MNYSLQIGNTSNYSRLSTQFNELESRRDALRLLLELLQ